MLDEHGRFVIHDYQQQRPFSSLLPGVAGAMGIPMWVFYVNRGQIISSFGVQDKDHAFMEFQPANKAYQTTPLTGFRTFIKPDSKPADLYEPFSPWQSATGIQRDLFIGMNEVEIQETNIARGFQINVLYFTLPGEPFAALIRQVTLKNIGAAPVDLELLDGMPVAIPYGIDHRNIKDISRTIEAWMQVLHLDQRLPYFRVGTTIGDSAEVAVVEKGFFALSVLDGQLLAPVVDPAVVFRQDTSLYAPNGFQLTSLDDLLHQRQVTRGKTPCAFFGSKASLLPGEAVRLTSAFGMVNDPATLENVHSRFTAPGFIPQKMQEARALTADLTEAIACRTSSDLFDGYSRQTFLDNALRGGWPVVLGSEANPVVYHLYSRKHGDLERDYNAFFLAAEHYSQGNGNFRDVVQNRRNDVFFHPYVGDFNIRTFLSLIQPDGYNPLVVKGSRFLLNPENQAQVMAQVEHPDLLKPVLSHAFTPGELLEAATNPQTKLRGSPEAFLNQVLGCAHQHVEADFGEGYWTDHWMYLLDLIENYLSIYPDRKADLLFGTANIPFYDSAHVVKPRSRKYVRVGGKVRQYEAVELDFQKSALIESRVDMPHWARSSNGLGEICQVTVFEKLAGLALLKFATLDPMGMGIEMEAGKPSWCDAMNGLPGLFGSSMAETLELQRLLSFLIEALHEYRDAKIFLFTEVADLFRQVRSVLKEWELDKSEGRDINYWDAVATLREKYREKVRLGFANDVETSIWVDELLEILQAFQVRLALGVARAVELNRGNLPTYLAFTVTSYEDVFGGDGKPRVDEQGRPFVRALRFEPHPLPLFLEGFVHFLKVQPDLAAARRLHETVRASGLYDRELKMYRNNVSLAGESHEIGRIRAFPPGWLENEAVFLHMEYKYLLELLKAGLVKEFFADAQTALVPFLDPVRYGRSPLENSSFIASSVYPDPTLHGGGFVARLTGATAEFLNMWRIMMAGQKPFRLQDGELILALNPSLPGWLFPQDGQLSFRLLGSCTVRLHNPSRLDIYDKKLQPVKTVLTGSGPAQIELTGSIIPAPYAAQVRDGQVSAIDIYYEQREGAEHA